MIGIIVSGWLALIVGSIWIVRAEPMRSTSTSLFLMGAGYIQMVMALFGPVTLFLGDPNQASPVLLLLCTDSVCWAVFGQSNCRAHTRHDGSF
ncbi:MAG: hypothetical protein HC883_04400 [Bdellovibrionaceae bacterium]|nr:hypothetical protein [Pseudobdellovibrionaceae bacterium]